MYALFSDTTPEQAITTAWVTTEAGNMISADFSDLESALRFCNAHVTADTVGDTGLMPEYIPSWDIGDHTTLYIGSSDDDMLTPHDTLAVYSRRNGYIHHRGFEVDDDRETLTSKTWLYRAFDPHKSLKAYVDSYLDGLVDFPHTEPFTFADDLHLVVAKPAEW